MFAEIIRSAVITAEREASLQKRSEELRERRRAFELYCSRSGPSDQTADRMQAERETSLRPLAGAESDGGEITITADILDNAGKHLRVDVLPGSLVVEYDSAVDGSVERCAAFPLHCAINSAKVRAEIT